MMSSQSFLRIREGRKSDRTIRIPDLIIFLPLYFIVAMPVILDLWPHWGWFS
jgi:hypothetical protein